MKKALMVLLLAASQSSTVKGVKTLPYRNAKGVHQDYLFSHNEDQKDQSAALNFDNIKEAENCYCYARVQGQETFCEQFDNNAAACRVFGSKCGYEYDTGQKCYDQTLKDMKETVFNYKGSQDPEFYGKDRTYCKCRTKDRDMDPDRDKCSKKLTIEQCLDPQTNGQCAWSYKGPYSSQDDQYNFALPQYKNNQQCSKRVKIYKDVMAAAASGRRYGDNQDADDEPTSRTIGGISYAKTVDLIKDVSFQYYGYKRTDTKDTIVAGKRGGYLDLIYYKYGNNKSTRDDNVSVLNALPEEYDEETNTIKVPIPAGQPRGRSYTHVNIKMGLNGKPLALYFMKGEKQGVVYDRFKLD